MATSITLPPSNLQAGSLRTQPKRRLRPSLRGWPALALLLCFGFGAPAQADYASADDAMRKKDYPKALQQCADLAKAGQAGCQMLLGQLYKYGWAVERDQGEAVKWMTKAADQGQVAAIENLADSYRLGWGVPQDFAKAMALFKTAAANGNTWAMSGIGTLHRLGQGVAKNPQEGLRWTRQAAEQGNPSAQAILADLYRRGDSVERSPDEAFQWALKSSKQDWPSGHNVLGLLLRDGVGVRRDSQRAIELFRMAAQSNRVPIAFANLAGMHYDAIGVPVNYDEAYKWAAEGVKVNEPNCMAILAGVYRRGARQAAANPALALEWATKSTALGNASGMNQLAQIYRDGTGVAVNLARALELFQSAAAGGVSASLIHMADMHEKGLGTPKNEALALQEYEQALAMPYVAPAMRPAAEAAVARLRALGPRVAGAALPAPSPAPAFAPPPIEEREVSRAELMDKLNLLQKQLGALQASSNTAAAQILASGQQAVYANRRALVIGNDGYRFVPRLQNAVFDAQSIAKAIEGVGYKVSLHTNLDEKSFKQALRDFKQQVQGGDEVLVFFAGHGVQLGAANYLLPVDMKGDSEEQVKDEAIQLQRVLDDLQEKKAKFALAIIDACRDNPFKGHGRAIGGRGLAPTTAATGQMVMFSAGAGPLGQR